MKTKDSEILKTACSVLRVSGLPHDRSPAKCTVGDGKVITLQKRKRQVLDPLLQSPVFAASPVRISDMVHLLKLEDSIDIETIMFPGDPGTGTSRYYVLRDRVERLPEWEAAA